VKLHRNAKTTLATGALLVQRVRQLAWSIDATATVGE
jgi:hypothetical protein